uniref:Uncharacterized protein n=2 Tax=Micrurus paraensis TaxID=1970185 RepID=A0A2D4L3E8_9SAUR
MAFHMQDSNTLLRKTCTDETWAQPALVKRTSVSRAVILVLFQHYNIQLIFSSTAPQGLAFLDKAVFLKKKNEFGFAHFKKKSNLFAIKSCLIKKKHQGKLLLNINFGFMFLVAVVLLQIIKNFNSFPIQTIRNVDGFFVSSQRLNCGAIFLCFTMFNGVSRSKETYKMKK